jgi:hypothetical protein
VGNLIKSKAWFKRIKVLQHPDGGPPTIRNYPVAASQIVLKGYPLTLNTTTGEVSVGADNSAAVIGVAMANVTTTAADEKTICPVAVADRRNIFEAQSSVAATNAFEVGTEYDYDIDTTAKTVKLIDATTEGHVTVVERTPGDSITDATYPGRLRFYFKRSQYDELVAIK